MSELAEALEPETPEPAPVDEPDEPETPEEPVEGLEAPDEGEGDGEPDEDEEGEPEAEAAPQGLSEQDLAKRDDKLRRENERHAGRVGEIMDDAAGDLIPCPVCMEGIAGWIYPPDVAPLEPEAVARIRQVIGLPDLSTFAEDPNTEACPVCMGRGETRTGSSVPGYETRTCPRCQKQGYVTKGSVTSTAGLAIAAEPTVTGPTVYTADESDPEIKHLRERGFTVIPPMTAAG